MEFGIGINTSQEIEEDKVNFIISISDELKEFLVDKFYGDDILKFYVGLICISPEFDSFYPVKKKYLKSDRSFEYDLKLSYEEIKNASLIQVKKIISTELVDSISVIEGVFKKFDVNSFKNDLILFFKEKGFI